MCGGELQLPLSPSDCHSPTADGVQVFGVLALVQSCHCTEEQKHNPQSNHKISFKRERGAFSGERECRVQGRLLRSCMLKMKNE